MVRTLDTEQTNKTLLLLFAGALLLVFLDVQARRQHTPARADRSATTRSAPTPTDKLSEIKKLVLDPIKATTEEIFGDANIPSPREVLQRGRNLEREGRERLPSLERLRRERLNRLERLDVSDGLENLVRERSKVFRQPLAPDPAIPAPARRTQRNVSPTDSGAPGSTGTVGFRNTSGVSPANHRGVSGDPRQVALYFFQFQRGKVRLKPVQRKINARDFHPAGLLALLQRGPAHSERGLVNAVTYNIRVLDLKIHRGVARVNLSGEFRENSQLIVRARAEQIRQTLLQFDSIGSVRILVEGRLFVLPVD